MLNLTAKLTEGWSPPPIPKNWLESEPRNWKGYHAIVYRQVKLGGLAHDGIHELERGVSGGRIDDLPVVEGDVFMSRFAVSDLTSKVSKFTPARSLPHQSRLAVWIMLRNCGF